MDLRTPFAFRSTISDDSSPVESETYSDEFLRQTLMRVHRIAMVGASTRWQRPSYFVMKYLLARGFEVLPVNPRSAGENLLGQTVYARLEDVPAPVDMVDIFRDSAAAGTVVDDAIRLKDEKSIRVIWMQLTVVNPSAAERARAAGLDVVMDRCPKIEWSRLAGELSWNGLNSRIVDSRRRKLFTR